MQSLLSIFTGNWSGFQNFSHFPLHFPSHPHSIIVMPCTTRRGGTNQISQKSWIKRSRGVKVNLKSKQHDRVAATPGSPLYRRKRSKENRVSHTLVSWVHCNHMAGATMQPKISEATENRVQWDLHF